MVGREKEMEMLLGSLEGCRQGRGSVVLISGNAGIGKTRLMEEFLKRAEGEGYQVFVGRCVPIVSTPYFPFIDAFKNYSTGSPGVTRRFFSAVKAAAPDIVAATPIIGSILRASVSFQSHYRKSAIDQDIFKEKSEERSAEEGKKRLLEAAKASAPDIAATAPIVGPYLRATMSIYKEYQKRGLDPKTENERVMFTTLSFLKNVSKDAPILICLEDLHWTDSATVRMLHFLARNPDGLNALIVGTYRPEEISIMGEGGIHPLQEALRVMRREGMFLEISLKPLNQDEVKRVAEEILGGAVDIDLLQMIFSESEGNPLFAKELIELASETGLICKDGGMWRKKKDVPFKVPSTIREIVLRRLEQLSRDERRIMETAAVIGERFDAEVLSEVLRVDHLQLLEALDLIAREHQLIQSSEGPFRFAHQKIQEVAFSEISEPRRRELHRLTGEVLETREGEEGLYGKLSYHFCQAKDDPRCIKYSLLAGAYNKENYATDEAIKSYKKVMEVTKDYPSYRDEVLQALEGLGDSFSNQGLVDEALEQYEKWLAMKPRILVKCSTLYLPTLKGDPQKSAQLLDEAEACKGLDDLERGHIFRNRGALADTGGNVAKAESYYFRALKIFEDEGNEKEMASVLDSLSLLLLTKGDLQGALERAQKGRDLLAKLNDFRGESAVSFRLATIYITLGEFEQSIESFNRAMEIDSKLGNYRDLSFDYGWRGIAEYTFDNFQKTHADALKGYELSLKAESKYSSAASSALLALSEVHLGNIEGARKHLEISNRLVEEIWRGFKGTVRTPTRPLNILANAEVHSAEGKWEECCAEYENAIAVFHDSWHNLLFEPLAYCRYGESLFRQGLKEEGKEKFSAAETVYKKIGNEQQVKRMEELIQELISGK